MATTEDNKALETRYFDRFLAFITSTDENQRQDAVFDKLVGELRRRSALPDSVDFIDLGCGPGEMTRSFIEGFRKPRAGEAPHEVQAYGIELNEDHARAAETNHGIHIIRRNIFEDGADLVQAAGLDHKPAAVIASHSGYYGPPPRVPDGQYRMPDLDQPTLRTLVGNMKRSMGPETIGFLQHKSTEPTNFLKRPHGAVVESDTNRALVKTCEQEGMHVFPVQFKCQLRLNASQFPELADDRFWEELQQARPYPESEFAHGKQIRDILEFLAHRGLEEMPPGERAAFLGRARTLIERDRAKGGIDTYVQMNVVLSQDAPRQLIKNVADAVAETNRQHGLPGSRAAG